MNINHNTSTDSSEDDFVDDGMLHHSRYNTLLIDCGIADDEFLSQPRNLASLFSQERSQERAQQRRESLEESYLLLLNFGVPFFLRFHTDITAAGSQYLRWLLLRLL